MENERAPLIGDKPPAYNPGPAYPPPIEQLPYPPSSEQVGHSGIDSLLKRSFQPPPVTNTAVTVVTQPPPVVMTTSFGESPVNITCPNCRNQVTTKTEYESGSLMWILVLVLCLIGLWPYVTHIIITFDVVHSCVYMFFSMQMLFDSILCGWV